MAHPEERDPVCGMVVDPARSPGRYRKEETTWEVPGAASEHSVQR